RRRRPPGRGRARVGRRRSFRASRAARHRAVRDGLREALMRHRPRGVTPSRVEVLAAAKVNLGFQVGAPRDDGFHDVAGLLQTISLHDTLVVEAADEPRGDVVADVDGTRVALVVDGPESADLATEDNLVMRAARVLARGMDARPVRITLTKQIPSAAGLGGG